MDTGFTFADVFDEAVARAGGEQATADDVEKVRRGLRLLTEEWNALGFNTWRIETTTIPLLPNEESYYLPSTLDDVLVVMHYPPNSRSGSRVQRMGIVEWAEIPDKQQPGTPSRFYLDRKEPPELHLHPIGQATGAGSLVVTYSGRPSRKSSDGTRDTPGRWINALIAGLAFDLAQKRPLPTGGYDEALIARLEAAYRSALVLAKEADRQRHGFKIRPRIR